MSLPAVVIVLSPDHREFRDHRG